MSSRWRRFEVLLPIQFDDGREVSGEWVAEAVLEIVDHFSAASYETQKVEGHWRHGAVLCRDNLVKVVVDVPDSAKNRQWMREFKGRWKARLEQLELVSVSDMLVTVKSRELQRGMLAEMRGDRTDAARHLLAAAHLELVLADDYAQDDQLDLALRSRLSAASCFWRAGQPDQAHELFEAMIQDHPMQK
jgi:hypothetical protein